MTKMTWHEFKQNVENWAAERGIYKHSTEEAQLLKALSELGELADAVIKNDREGLKDAVGDVAVCMVNYAYMQKAVLLEPQVGAAYRDAQLIATMCSTLGSMLGGYGIKADSRDFMRALGFVAANNDLEFLDCCHHAWLQIKDRTGRMVEGGAFVKD